MKSGDIIFGGMNTVDNNVFEIISAFGSNNVSLKANMTNYPTGDCNNIYY